MSSVFAAIWMKRSVVAAAAIGSLGLGPAWGQTATIRDNQLLVDRQSHWEEWHFPPGTVEVERGAVRPHYVSKNIDATGDIVAHLKRNPGNKDPEEMTLLDAIDAGVNKGDVANLFDDDESTYWEPGIGSPLGELSKEVHAWLSQREKSPTRVKWQFTTDDARIKLHRLYPALLHR